MKSIFTLLNENEGKILRIAENFGTYKGKHFIEYEKKQKELNLKKDDN
jgi:hypothetical protein